MTCSGCIHEDACKHLIDERNEVLVRCEHFLRVGEGEVVRCRDCVYADIYSENEVYCMAAECCTCVALDDYCSKGVRRKDNV